MELTPELLADYTGHESLLRWRALHPPHCYPFVDSLRLCVIHREKNPDECMRYAVAYKPCAAEVTKQRAIWRKEREEARRQYLAAAAREKELAQGAAT